jgi:hypothetical protein
VGPRANKITPGRLRSLAHLYIEAHPLDQPSAGLDYFYGGAQSDSLSQSSTSAWAVLAALRFLNFERGIEF